MWKLPRPGLELVSSALASGFLSSVPPKKSYFIFLVKKTFKIIYIFHCVGFSLLHAGVVSGGTLPCGVRVGPLIAVDSTVAEHRPTGASRWRAPAQHGPSDFVACGILPTRDETCVPCIGRQTPIHCTTKEVLGYFIITISESLSENYVSLAWIFS